MARPRTPTNVLEMRGAFKANPQRREERKDEPVVHEPIGEPPKSFTADQLQAWNDLVTHCPSGVLTKADAMGVEEAARLLAKSRAGTADSNDRRLFANYLSRFGMTPADRSRVKVVFQDSKPSNPFASIK